jgi:TonB family protein
MGSTLPSAIAVGRLIDGRFPLLEQLGGTNWSAAYKTELDYDPRRKAAVKVFAFDSVDPRVTLARWDVARTLSHPHLMPLLHAGRCAVDGEDLLYVVTEYAEETLSQVLPERPLTIDEGRQMLGPVLEALSYLHKLGLTHGHLRPTNIMVVGDHLKLSPDFGWRARTRSVYDPPEVSTAAPAPAADIWSLGILLVESFTQQPPDWDKLVGDQPEALDAVPEPFFTIARECLQIDPARRCTIADIKAHLNPLRVEEPIAEPAALPPARPVVERAEKRSYKSLAFIAMCLALALFFLVAAFRLGWDLTPATPAPVVTEQTVAPLQTSAPAAADAQTQPSAAELAEEQPSGQATDSAAAQAPAETAASPAAPVAVAAPTVETASASKPPVATKSSAGGVVKAAVAQQVLPDIPARIIGTIRGHVNVGIRVEVDAAGNVAQASIDSQGPSRYFADQALKAAQSWKFTPAQVDGRAAASTWLVQFQFGNSDITANESEQTP